MTEWGRDGDPEAVPNGCFARAESANSWYPGWIPFSRGGFSLVRQHRGGHCVPRLPSQRFDVLCQVCVGEVRFVSVLRRRPAKASPFLHCRLRIICSSLPLVVRADLRHSERPPIANPLMLYKAARNVVWKSRRPVRPVNSPDLRQLTGRWRNHKIHVLLAFRSPAVLSDLHQASLPREASVKVTRPNPSE